MGKKIYEVDPEVLAEQFVDNNANAFRKLDERLKSRGLEPGSAGHTAASISFGILLGHHQVTWWEIEEKK